MRLVFMGSPDMAIPSLLAASEVSDLTGVITQPPRGKGRGRKEMPSPVAVKAAEMGIEAMTPGEIKSDGFLELFKAMEPDLALVVAYGKILPPQVLTVPRLGCVNVHASLLPELRGAAPIQWAIARDYRTTGVTLMQMDEGMDTGPVLMQKKTGVGEGEDAYSLAGRLSQMAGQIVKEGIPALAEGRLTPTPQDDSNATYAPMLKKEDGRVNWQMDSAQIANRVRAFVPWPGVYTHFKGKRLLITGAESMEWTGQEKPGTVIDAGKDGIDVVTGSGIFRIITLQPEGKREMSPAEFLAGHIVSFGDIMGEEQGQ